jgi:uncharacterized membrane protein HdeD (DUF308 family)
MVRAEGGCALRVVIAVTERRAKQFVAHGVVGAIFLVPLIFALQNHIQVLAVIIACFFCIAGVYGLWRCFAITFGWDRRRR